MSLFPRKKNTIITVCEYIRSAHSVLRACNMPCTIWKWVAYAYQKPLSMPPTFKRRLFAPFSYTETSSLRGCHPRMDTSAGLRHAYASLSLHTPCCKKPPNIVPDPVTVHCGQCYNLKPSCQVAENFGEKTRKVILKMAKENTSVVDPYSGASWIWIRMRNTDPVPDPHMQSYSRLKWRQKLQDL